MFMVEEVEEDEESEGVKPGELVTFSTRVKRRATDRRKTMAKDEVGKLRDMDDSGRVVVWFGKDEGVWRGTVAEVCVVTDPGQLKEEFVAYLEEGFEQVELFDRAEGAAGSAATVHPGTGFSVPGAAGGGSGGGSKRGGGVFDMSVELTPGDMVELFGLSKEKYNGQYGVVQPKGATGVADNRLQVQLLSTGEVLAFKRSNLKHYSDPAHAAVPKRRASIAENLRR